MWPAVDVLVVVMTVRQNYIEEYFMDILVVVMVVEQNYTELYFKCCSYRYFHGDFK